MWIIIHDDFVDYIEQKNTNKIQNQIETMEKKQSTNFFFDRTIEVVLVWLQQSAKSIQNITLLLTHMQANIGDTT